MSDAPDADADGPVDVDVDIDDERTIITVTGQRDAAVVVYSASGERIYLPPEEATREQSDPYRPAGGADSPYEGDRGDQTPYAPSHRTDPSVGMNATSDGFQILHPEPVHDLRLLR